MSKVSVVLRGGHGLSAAVGGWAGEGLSRRPRIDLRPMNGTSLPHVRPPIPGPVSAAWVDRLARTECQGVTAHRVRPPGAHLQGPEDPIVWSQARGANVLDVDGNLFVDLCSAFGVASVGHAHPRVVAAVRKQAARLPHAMADVFPDERRVELLEALCAVSGMDRVILGSSGSDAVEAAVKTARVATGRTRVLAFAGSYHGLSYGNVATTAFKAHLFRRPFEGQVAAHVDHAPFGGPLPSLEPYAAVLVEPIQGRGGVNVPPPGWLATLVREAHAAGSIVIFDEIFTGFGRTGAWFAFQDEGLDPDLVCVGKGMSSGFPISACLGRARVMDAWAPSDGEAIHTQTFLGNPLGCAMALAAISVLRDLDLPDRTRRRGRWFSRRLEAVPGVREVRGRGLLLAVRTDANALDLSLRMLRKGYICLPVGEGVDLLGLSPPLVITRPQLDGAVRALAECLAGAA